MAAQSLLHGLPATPVNSLSSSSFMLQKSFRMLFLCSHFMYGWGGQCAISVVALVSMTFCLHCNFFLSFFRGYILAFLSRGFDRLKLPDVKFLSSCGRRGWMSHLRFVRVSAREEI
jgi:hypothetical protein